METSLLLIGMRKLFLSAQYFIKLGNVLFHVILTAFTKTNTSLMNRIFRDIVYIQSPVALNGNLSLW